jgi:hypothetical protein
MQVAKVVKFENQKIDERIAYAPAGFAEYFVSAAAILKFTRRPRL